MKPWSHFAFFRIVYHWAGWELMSAALQTSCYSHWWEVYALLCVSWVWFEQKLNVWPLFSRSLWLLNPPKTSWAGGLPTATFLLSSINAKSCVTTSAITEWPSISIGFIHSRLYNKCVWVTAWTRESLGLMDSLVFGGHSTSSWEWGQHRGSVKVTVFVFLFAIQSLTHWPFDAAGYAPLCVCVCDPTWGFLWLVRGQTRGRRPLSQWTPGSGTGGRI